MLLFALCFSMSSEQYTIARKPYVIPEPKTPKHTKCRCGNCVTPYIHFYMNNSKTLIVKRFCLRCHFGKVVFRKKIGNLNDQEYAYWCVRKDILRCPNCCDWTLHQTRNYLH